MRHILAFVSILICSSAFARPALIEPIDPASCLQAAKAAEHQFAVPDRLLAAIAEVESVRNDPVTHRSAPWPWTINVEGAGHFYETKQAAIDAVRAFQAAGARSIDIGCMQINLMYHPNAFASLEDGFDPQINAVYGGRFLRDLFRQTGNWPQAAAFYHSQTPTLGSEYASNVMARWPLAGRFATTPATIVATPIKTADYSAYTPAFAATLRSMDHDLATAAPGPQPAAHRIAATNRLASARHGRGYDQPS